MYGCLWIVTNFESYITIFEIPLSDFAIYSNNHKGFASTEIFTRLMCH